MLHRGAPTTAEWILYLYPEGYRTASKVENVIRICRRLRKLPTSSVFIKKRHWRQSLQKKRAYTLRLRVGFSVYLRAWLGNSSILKVPYFGIFFPTSKTIDMKQTLLQILRPRLSAHRLRPGHTILGI